MNVRKYVQAALPAVRRLVRDSCHRGKINVVNKQYSLGGIRLQSTVASPGTRREFKDQASREKANYQARVDLAAAYRALDFYKLGEGICNHLTLRAPSRVRDDDVMLVIPYGLHWKEVTASCLLGIDFFTDEIVEGDGEPNEAASCIHRPIHNARYEVDGITAVMHTHQPYATTLACMDEPEAFKTDLSQNTMRFHGKVAYDLCYDGLAELEDEGKRLAKALGDKEILMMGQHGVLSVGKRACDAFDALYYLERGAEVQVKLMSTGAKMLSAPESVASRIANDDYYEMGSRAHFESLKRVLANEKPHFTD